MSLSFTAHASHLNCCRQLEVLRNNDDGSEKGSLLWLMDHTKTPFGGRLLRNWVAHPLTNRQRINERLDAVDEMVAAGSAMEQGSKPQLRQPILTVPSILTYRKRPLVSKADQSLILGPSNESVQYC